MFAETIAEKEVEIVRLMAEIERLRSALEMIAGRRPCPDNLLGNDDIARLALEQSARGAGVETEKVAWPGQAGHERQMRRR